MVGTRYSSRSRAVRTTRHRLVVPACSEEEAEAAAAAAAAEEEEEEVEVEEVEVAEGEW